MPDLITVESIIREKLKELGADGLCNDGCGCSLSDLAPCIDGFPETCQPAWASDCPNCGQKWYWATRSDEPRLCGECEGAKDA